MIQSLIPPISLEDVASDQDEIGILSVGQGHESAHEIRLRLIPEVKIRGEDDLQFREDR